MLAVETVHLFCLLRFFGRLASFLDFSVFTNDERRTSVIVKVVPHNSLTEFSVFPNDFICSLILFACFASPLSKFCILFSLFIMSLFDVLLYSQCIFVNFSKDFLVLLVSLYGVGFISCVIPSIQDFRIMFFSKRFLTLLFRYCLFCCMGLISF